MQPWMRRFQNRIGYKINHNKRIRKNVIFAILFSILIFLFVMFNLQIRPMMIKMAQTSANQMGVIAINTAISEELNSYNITYQDLISIQKKESGEVTALQANLILMNKLKSELVMSILNKINSIKSTDIQIPLGNIINQDVLSGRGPKVHITVVPYGYANIQFTDSFSAAGINQTRHQIQLHVTAKIAVLLPTANTYTDVETTVPVAETVIVGNVPQTYLNVEGATGSTGDNALRLYTK